MPSQKRPVLSPKSTAVGGVNFEHAVAASFMACLLGDTAPLAEELGRLVSVEFQTGDAYRPLDDILLHLDCAGVPRRCALSVRSNRQFTEAGAPDDFVAAVWRLALEPGETAFKLDHDRAGLMTASLARGVADALHALLRAAAAQDATRSLPTPKGRMQTALLNSFACPPNLAARHAPDEDKVRRVLRSVVHQEFDFEQQNSTNLKHALGICRSALASGDAAEAELLWGDLCEFARQLCPNEGVLTRAGLLDRLRKKFSLRALPNHEPDWLRLHDATQRKFAAIRDVIGDTLRLPRDVELRELAGDNARWIALHGESGVGKTVVAKWWGQSQPTGVRVWWLSAEALDAVSFSAFEQSLGLRNQLADLLATTPEAAAWLIVDGLDMAYEPQVFRHLSQLLRLLPDCWRVLLACQTEHWERVQNALQEANLVVGWSLIEVPPPTVPDEALARFTNLQPLLQRPRLRSLITRPKYLDSLARRFDPASYRREWVGESDLLAWFWQTEVASPPHGSARAEVVKKLGARLGDSLRADVASDEFTVADHEHIDGLIGNRICRRRNERITVAHDRIGDWARQRVLLGRLDELPQFLADRLDSPLWLFGLRLLGIEILEQDADLARWTRVFEQLGALPSGQRAQDALLEAALFAEQSDVLLEKVWPMLAAERGRLLGRLLNRFAHTGTLPKRLINHLPAEQAMHLTDVRYRVPIAHHWPSLLQVLHAHRDEAIEFAPFSVAKLAGCWLENGPATGAARREAAELALDVGRRALAWTRQENFYLEREQAVPPFRAALLAAAELPDEAATFARDAAFRLPEQLSTRRYVKVTVKFGPSYSGYYPPPWPDGPAQELDEGFQRAALDNATLGPLMAARPDVAKEVLLTALIAPPQEPDPHLRDNTCLQDKLCLDEGSDYSLAHPFRGPFLSLLHVNPDVTIDAIARLTNFAAERWTKTTRAGYAQPREVVVRFGETERTLLGDYHVFTWYRSGPCPHALTAALMALEFWFTEQLLVGTGYENAVAKLLELTNNVALAGLLCAVGCQKPDLFAGVLSPLTTAPEFHDWEMARRIAPEIGAMFSDRPDEKLARNWDNQPWRRRGLDEIAFEFFRTNEAFRNFIEPVTAHWEERAASAEASPRFKFLVEQKAPRFRRANYREVEAGAPLAYMPPAALVQRNAERQHQLDVHSLPHQFPFDCRALLCAGKPMPDTELEDFWQTLEFIDRLEKLPEDDAGVMRKETSYCAAAAVLFILHRPWLRAHPARERWLIERVTSFILAPPPAALMDDDRDIWGFDWSAYAALVVPVLWQESPAEPATRRLVARLAIYRKYKTVEYLCAGVAARRRDLGEQFIELLEFVCDWAVEKRRAEGRRFDEEPPYDLAPWLEREVEAFVSRSRPRKSIPWHDLSVEVEPPLPWRPNLPRPMRYTFDVELWQAVFAWMPRLLADPTEHDWVLSFWRHHLALALQRLNAKPRDRDSRACLPYRVEQWLLKCVARAVLDLPSPEERASFWQPIFSTAPHGAHWIEEFAAALLGFAQTDAQSSVAFVETWPRMVEWALGAPDWAYSWKASFTLAQAWRALLGFENAAEFLNVCGDHLVTWKHYFARWATDWLAERSCAILFCRFLEEQQAHALLPDGLSWLGERLPPKLLRHQRDVSNAVGELLVLLLRTRREAVLGNLQTLQTFRALLSRLSEIQHPRAIEVETLLAGGEGG